MSENRAMGNRQSAVEDGEAGAARRAYTIMELLVVILILGVLLLLAVPSFSAMLRSSEETMAETLLRNALRSGREAALRGGGRQDGAVVFTYDPSSQRFAMITCTKVGELVDAPPPGVQVPVVRDVFVPLETAEPIQLPKGWMVRGYAPVNAVDFQWYAPGQGQMRRYGVNPREGDWVFPETSWFNKNVVNDGINRQTFMVRFEAGTGLVSPANGNSALIFLPEIDLKARTGPVWGKYAAFLKDSRRYVQTALVDNFLTDITRRNLLGDLSGDTVLAKPVKALALGDERKLAAALGVRVDTDTGSLYSGANPAVPAFVGTVTASRVRHWIEGNGDLNGNGTPDSREPNYLRDARVYLIDRFTSELREAGVEP